MGGSGAPSSGRAIARGLLGGACLTLALAVGGIAVLVLVWLPALAGDFDEHRANFEAPVGER